MIFCPLQSTLIFGNQRLDPLDTVVLICIRTNLHFIRTHHFNTTRVIAVVVNWNLFPFHSATEQSMTIIIWMSNAVIDVRAFLDINQSWSFVLIQLFYNCSCDYRDVWVLCIFPKWNRPASPGKQPHLVQFLTFTVKLTSMVINDKRTTSVVITTIIH